MGVLARLLGGSGGVQEVGEGDLVKEITIKQEVSFSSIFLRRLVILLNCRIVVSLFDYCVLISYHCGDVGGYCIFFTWSFIFPDFNIAFSLQEMESQGLS